MPRTATAATPASSSTRRESPLPPLGDDEPPSILRNRGFLRLVALFVAEGVVMGTWTSRLPELAGSARVGAGGLGLVLLVMSCFSVTTILLVGRVLELPRAQRDVEGAETGAPGIADRVATRHVLSVSGALALIGIAVIGTSVDRLPGWLLLAVGLAILGVGGALVDGVANIEGTRLQARLETWPLSRRPLRGRLMPLLHGWFSLGMLVGALIGALASHGQVGFRVHSAVVMGVLAFGLAMLWRRGSTDFPCGRLASSSTRASERSPMDESTARSIWRERSLVSLAILVLGMAIAEGAANEWLPTIVAVSLQTSPARAAEALVLFLVAMTVVRFATVRVGDTVNSVGMLAWSAGAVVVGCASVGGATVIHADHPWVVLVLSGVGIVCWGAGTALAVPLGISAAATLGEPGDKNDRSRSARRVTAINAVVYGAAPAGPALLGSVGAVGGYGAVLVSLPVLMLGAVGISTLVHPTRGAERLSSVVPWRPSLHARTPSPGQAASQTSTSATSSRWRERGARDASIDDRAKAASSASLNP